MAKTKTKTKTKTKAPVLGPLAYAVPWRPKNPRLGAGQRYEFDVGQPYDDVLITTNGPFEPKTVDCLRGDKGILVLKMGKSTVVNCIYLVPAVTP